MTAATEATDVRRDVVVVGASAGGVESLAAFVAHLPADLPATVLIVLHMPSGGSSALTRILERAGSLPVSVARGGEDLHRGRCLVAPADRHLMIIEEQVRLSQGPRENGHRPAADVLFRSAARALGQRVVAVVLSGAMDDGTAGSLAVQQRGGAVLAQRPGEAPYASMPASVLENVPGVIVADATDLGALVADLCRTPVPRNGHRSTPGLLDLEVQLVDLLEPTLPPTEGPGTPAGFGCPDCNGSMFRIDDIGPPRYRCRVGHAWTATGLLQQQSEAMESALWMALRSLEEKSALSHQLADQARERGSVLTADRFLEQSQEARRAAALVRQLIQSPRLPSMVDDDSPREDADV